MLSRGHKENDFEIIIGNYILTAAATRFFMCYNTYFSYLIHR